MELRKAAAFFWDTIKLAVVALLIVLPIRYFVVQPFFVMGASMEPNFQNGDYLIIDEISYRVDNPQRGDVIVFHYPLNPRQYYIKRIIGLPGEVVVLSKDGVVIKNKEHPEGFMLKEDYLEGRPVSYKSKSVVLGDDEYFVMGDNRMASSDSREWGPLPKKFIVGKVLLRAFPFQKAEIYR